MVGLLDIAPLVETVTIRGKPLPVRGLSINDIAGLIQRFPEVGKALGGGLTVDMIASMGRELVAAIIACALSEPSGSDCADEDETEEDRKLRLEARDRRAKEKRALEASTGNLLPDEALKLLEATIELTAPGGLLPFVERLTAMFGQSSVPAASGTGPVLN